MSMLRKKARKKEQTGKEKRKGGEINCLNGLLRG